MRPDSGFENFLLVPPVRSDPFFPVNPGRI